MKSLVTGAAGFIGSNLCERLIFQGHDVIAVDNLSTGKLENLDYLLDHKELSKQKRFMFHELDITNKVIAENLVESFSPDYIFHLAAQMNVRHSVADPQFDATNNILGIINMLEASKNKVKKFIFSSSGGAIYGDNVPIPTHENEREHPCSPYGVSKLASEKYLDYYKKQYGLSTVSLRYANVYGQKQDSKGEAGVVAIFISKILNNEHPIINGEGTQTRDYIYINDVVEANLLSLHSKVSGVYNIGTGIETSVNSLYQKISSKLNSEKKEIHGQTLPGEQLRSCLDYTRFSDATGWKPYHSLDEGLDYTIRWFSSQNKP